MELLVAEDERRVRGFISRGLREEGLAVREAADGEEALALAAEHRFRLLLLDWRMPKASGLDVLQTLRGRGDMTPVLMVTARDAVEDRVAALNAGADDYLVKPFAFDELIARVRAVLRRAEGRPQPVLACADLVLDPSTRKVTRGGRELRLTAREFALLEFLLANKDRVVTRTRIVEAVWEHDFETFSNVVEVYVRYLRQKVDEPFGKRLIHTVRGVGYVLRDEELM
jgi:two-component system copper resistance phosphate regulon response regulator CusR